ncbi:MAG: DUF393 domain-containing protein [Bacteroidales bacterium]|nr:DUF393 domain-containing protein [Bacteroidales bacterium]
MFGMSEKNHVILFDGVCNVCIGVVHFLIKRDKKKKFRYTALQSDEGQSILNSLRLSATNFDTLVLIQGNKTYIKSTAILHVCKALGGVWSLFYIFILIPKTFRDGLYNVFAKNRYRFFGKQNSCMITERE